VRGFAELPGHVLSLAADGAERIALVLVDAFGRRFLERHAEHPLLQRMEITPLESQFPTTTTAHLTTLYTTLPVGEHGLYEWNVYEPSLDAVILPLPFVRAGRGGRPLPLSPHSLVPGPTLFERLDEAGTASTVLQPAPIARSRYGAAALHGATVVPFDGLGEASRLLPAALDQPGLVYLYWDGVDYTGHLAGPSSAAFDEASRAALDAIEAGIRQAPPGTRLLVTADHGQVDVDPARVDLLDLLWPPLLSRLRLDARRQPLPPAGSARDCFLHIVPGHAREVASALAQRLEDRALVRMVDELVAEGLFGAVGPRLRARLGDICILPAPGRMAWLAAFPGPERHFRGHHGGLEAAERETWVGTLTV
jgi:Type I phosphodiesterase / nucleotide pyrophosphatase